MPHTWHDVIDEETGEVSGFISIHMPHTWHDFLVVARSGKGKFISIHMPHTWHDRLRSTARMFPSAFQSTCHIRGMTSVKGFHAAKKKFQSTCHIRGMTELRARSIGAFVISIHMPHTWHDRWTRARSAPPLIFQSTCHIRGMTS